MSNIDPVLNMLERGLDFASRRQRVLASNIANAETPGYERRDVAAPAFEDLVRESDAETDPAPRVAKGGKVVMESELATASTNSLYYSTLARLASLRLSMAELAIRGK